MEFLSTTGFKTSVHRFVDSWGALPTIDGMVVKRIGGTLWVSRDHIHVILMAPTDYQFPKWL